MKFRTSPAFFIKTAAAMALAASALAAPAQAATWFTSYGVMMSDTCVAPNGTYMVFANQSGQVGSGCHFYFNGLPVMHYGVFR